MILVTGCAEKSTPANLAAGGIGLGGFSPALGNARNGFQCLGIGYVLTFFKGFRQLRGLFADHGLGNGISDKFHGGKALTGLLMQRPATVVAKVTRWGGFQLLCFITLQNQPAFPVRSSPSNN